MRIHMRVDLIPASKSLGVCADSKHHASSSGLWHHLHGGDWSKCCGLGDDVSELPVILSDTPPLQDETYAIGPSYNGEASQWHSCCHMSSELNRSWHRFHAGVALQAVLRDGVQAPCMKSIEKEG